ncbi:GNAT family N-acetyltransferase [Actinoplanes sp. TRM 88003]|uniref:GNAT family N-acetyltransferase n=1 Tax=Paractinoplanes aksuensis TaxID=2939490 RepID=A0ABT1DFQ8_9ACTN|nr:GNAT family N-acetyltransferase [Actinoplanes aksuensis]MCO8269624.1 GNAT family N-acetyltransferase [Actinoplanes aksuensis]
MPPVTFSAAGSADSTRIAALHADSWRRHYRGAYADTYLDGDLLSERSAVWASRLASPTGTATIIAERSGHLTGFVHVLLDADPHWGSLIDNLHVHHTEHRTGVGTQLMTHAARAAITHGKTRALHLWVLQQNTRAQKFYVACGGTVVETGTVTAPHGNAAFLNGKPTKYCMAWPDATPLVDTSNRIRSERRPHTSSTITPDAG